MIQLRETWCYSSDYSLFAPLKNETLEVLELQSGRIRNLSLLVLIYKRAF